MDLLKLTERGESVTFAVRVTPRTSRDQLGGVRDGALQVRVQAPASEGRANAALIAFLAERLHVPRHRVEIIRGHTSRNKIVRVHGATMEHVRARLAQ